MRRLAPVLVVALAGALGCPGAPSADDAGVTDAGAAPLYRVSDGHLVDADGHVLWLHGVNVHEESKWTEGLLVETPDEDLATLAAHGVNMARVLAFWQAIAPDEGRVDDGYLARLTAEIGRLTASGLYVVVDMHQDLWGEPFGKGAPSWACPDDVTAGYAPASPWWVGYFSDQVTGCFDRLWTDEALLAAYTDAWAALAGAVCDDPLVVGFDLMNEPWPGSYLDEAEFDQGILYERVYRAVMARVDEVCPGRVFFLEPSRAYDFGLMDPLAILDEDRPRVVLAPHYYPPDVHEPGRAWEGTREALADELTRLFDAPLADGVPVWIGEYGGLAANPGFDTYVSDFITLTTERGIGRALWALSRGHDFSLLDDEGAIVPAYARAFSAPALVRTPGPAAVTVDVTAGTLVVETTCASPKVIEVAVSDPGARMITTVPPPGTGVVGGTIVTGSRVVVACEGDGAVTLIVE